MPTSTTPKTKAAALAAVQALIAGTQKHFPNETFTLGNATYTTASLLQFLQNLAQTMTALNAAEQAAKDARTTTQGAQAQASLTIQAYKRYLLAAFVSAGQTLADFGLEAPKARTPLSTEQKAVAAAKAVATRKARGTASKKQKLTVKGNVTGVIVTPITSPSAAAPAVPVNPVLPATPSAQPVSTASSVLPPSPATK